jgi:hypothetical protein
MQNQLQVRRGSIPIVAVIVDTGISLRKIFRKLFMGKNVIKQKITSRTILGWAYSTIHENGVLTPPVVPQYTGTVLQIQRKIDADRQYQADRTTLRMIELWFYRDAVIIDIEGYGLHPYAIDLPSVITLDRFGYTAILDRVPTKPNQGRGRLLDERVTISTTLDKSDVTKLDRMSGSNRSDKLRNLIRRKS